MRGNLNKKRNGKKKKKYSGGELIISASTGKMTDSEFPPQLYIDS